MDKTTKTTIHQKITLIAFGLVLSFVLLEMGLRLGRFVLLSLQEHRNRILLRQKGVCRIMCIGESTTVGSSYPLQLQDILNQHNIGINFVVINKGVGAVDTSCLLSQLEENIRLYQPDMVIAMMGINDSGPLVYYDIVKTSQKQSYLKSSRTYKLIKLLQLHIVAKTKEIGIFNTKENKKNSSKEDAYQKNSSEQDEALSKETISLDPEELARSYVEQNRFIEAEEAFKKAIELSPKDGGLYVELGMLYRDKLGDFSQAEEMFKQPLKLKPDNDAAYNDLGCLYRTQGKLSEAEEMFKKAIELNPFNERAYTDIAWVYENQGKFSQAEEMFKQALKLKPDNDATYNDLGCLYRTQGKLSEAEEMFKKALQFNPNHDSACVGLGLLYRDQGKLSEAEEMFKKAIELRPNDGAIYNALGWVDVDKKQGKISQAEEMFRKIHELNPQYDRVTGGLASIYQEMGEYKLAEKYYSESNELKDMYCNAMTRENYQKLKQILDKRGIKLLCVQYPVLSVEALKKMFEEQDGVVFVDNEKVFKEALKKENYREYFSDMFGGEFGHCTKKGDRLLAENIANVLLKEYFKK